MRFTTSGYQLTFYKWLIWALAIFYIFIHIRLSQYAFDDAYIHFRAARNLLDLGAPYFNADQAVKVSSSSGWTIFLAALIAPVRLLHLENEFPLILSLVNALISLGGMWIFTKIVEKLNPRQLTPGKKFFFEASFLSMMAISSIGLMETPLAMLLAGIGIYSLLTSDLAGFLWLGVSIYFRVELIVVVTVLGILFVLRSRFQFWKMILLAGAGILPFLVFDLYFFQTIIPHSIVAKSLVYSITGLHTFTRLVYLSFPFGLLNNQLLSFTISLILLMGLLLSTMISALQRWKSNQSDWTVAFVVCSLLIGLGYISRHVLLFEWYLPLFTVPAFLALTLCANRGPEHGSRNISLHLWLTSAVFYLLGLGQISYAAVMNPGLYDQFEAGSRVKVYLAVGRVLHNAYPDSTLLSSEIGGLGYTYKGGIFDAAGLASPDALDFHPMKVPDERERGDLGAIPTNYVEQVMPDIIVSYDQFAEKLLASRVVQQYNMILIPAYLQQDFIYAQRETMWGDAFLRIYIRKDFPIAEELTNWQIK